MSGERRFGGVEVASAAAVAVAAAAVLFARFRSNALLGWDTYPQIASARIHSWADFVGTFTEDTADGVYPSSFYRPVFNLSLALDYAAWELEPLGYVLTNAALLAACAVAVFVLARRLLGAGARLGPWVALAAFLLLPAHVEVVALPSRRMEILCGLFSCLALATQLPRLGAVPARAALPALFTLLATGAKETGVVLLPLVFALALLFTPAGGLRERLVAGARTAAPHLAAVLLVFLARFAALGELGGHPSTSALGAVTRLHWALGLMLVRLSSLVPNEIAPTRGWAPAVLTVAVFALSIASAAPWLRAGAGGRSRERATVVLGLVWLVGLAGVYGVSGMLQPWHLLIAALATAIAVGALAEALRRGLSSARRPLAASGLALIALWGGLQAWHSPLFRHYGHWEAASARLDGYLEAFGRELAATPVGGTLRMPPPPTRLPTTPNRFGAVSATAINVYSLPSWVALRFPERRIDIPYLRAGTFPYRRPPAWLVIHVRSP